MPVDPSSIPSYSDADILKVLRLSLVNTALAKGYTVNGRSVEKMSGREIQDLIQEYEWRVYRATNGIFQAGATRPAE